MTDQRHTIHSPALTVVVLTLNEEGNLPRCLTSLAPLQAQVIVVDSGSTDRTLEIARTHGAETAHQPWLGMAGQRRASLELGAAPWILALDADEELTPELALEINAFLAGNPVENAASFPRITRFLNRWIRHGDWYPDVKLRLVRRGAATVSGFGGHEEMHSPLPIRQLTHPLRHYSFQNLAHYCRKMTAFATDFEAAAAQKGKNWGLLTILFRPCWRFFRAYVLKLGFLDGFPGFWIAVSTAYFTFLRYSLIRERNRD